MASAPLPDPIALDALLEVIKRHDVAEITVGDVTIRLRPSLPTIPIPSSPSRPSVDPDELPTTEEMERKRLAQLRKDLNLSGRF